MRKLLLILFFACLTAGCGSTLKNSWNNFRAYYNTYYNAEKNFRAGFRKVQDQPVTLEPNTPVRIHLAPVSAGDEDFEQAIDKGAQILRKFPNSKWTDDALLLIGKSYYYQQEFYAALEKFEELQNLDSTPQMNRQAVIWKGRTLLELEQYSEGVSYLEAELSQYSASQLFPQKGEMQALAAEHHAMLENWEQSADLLSQALSQMESKKLLGRAFFLYGQMLERLERFGEAHYAYSRVSENFPGFEYTYWAKIKQADVARKERNYNLAISIYESLRKDDKNFDRRDELSYEIARTLEMKGEIEEAETRYKDLLYGNNENIQKRTLRSEIYYRLGKINSENYSNYGLAAAYFDSSSSMANTQNTSDELENAQTLSEAFGNYTKFQKTIQRADSLLWLGSLDPSELDSILEEIRQKKRQQLIAQRQDQPENRLVNRSLQSTDSNSTTSSSMYGFLNHRNAELVNRAKSEFRLIWSNRPLVDNWRRLEVVQGISSGDQSSRTDQNQAVTDPEIAEQLTLNIDEIPKTSADKERLKIEKETAQYELGNLLFLTLNKPDSARFYFHQVIKDNQNQELRPRAMYSLYEVFNAQNMQDSLEYWKKQITEQYPNSKYAKRVKLDGQTASEAESDSADKLIQQYHQINNSEIPHKAAKLRSLALANRSSDAAPYIHYQAIETYIREAKTHQEISDSLASDIFASDSVKVNSTSDSAKTDAIEELSFKSSYWDSVRVLIQEFDTTFTNSKQRKKVTALREILQKQEETTQLPSCENLGITLSVQPGMKEFLSTLEYPEKLANKSLSGEVRYSFIVTKEGAVESYSLTSNRTSLGIEEVFEKGFEKSLQFAPLDMENPPDKVRCEISFPIQR